MNSPPDLHCWFKLLIKRLKQGRKRYRWVDVKVVGDEVIDKESLSFPPYTLEYPVVPEEEPSERVNLHILICNGFIPVRLISKLWEEIHESPVVWIERVKGVNGLVGIWLNI